MKFLLDTHAFLWWDSDPALLGRKAYAHLVDSEATVFLSIASIWEMQIKMSLGKLDLDRPLKVMLGDQQRNHIQFLAITVDHVFRLADLPSHHKDPFDRILIAQALAENCVILSKDGTFPRYGVPVAWA